MLTWASWRRVVKDWFGPEAMRRFQVRFSKQVWPGDDAHVHRRSSPASATRAARRLVDLELDGREPGRRRVELTGHRDRRGRRRRESWGSSTAASRSSPDPGAASAASSRCAWRARARSVVVNDVGVALDGQGTDDDPAAQVCKEIEALGGEAVPNYDSVSDFDGAERIVQTAVDSFGTARHPRQQRRHRARPDAAEDGGGATSTRSSRCT